MRRTLLTSTAVLIATLTLAGCTASAGSSVAQDGPVPAQEGGAADGGSLQSGGAAEAPGTDGAVAAPTERQVVVTGDVTITAEDPLAASREAVRIVEAAGGRVDGRTEYAPSQVGDDCCIAYDVYGNPPGRAGSATLELRIPADKLTATLDELEKLGRADQVTLSSSDVTVASQDLDARISALRGSIERLSALAAQAGDLDDLIRLEDEVSNRQGELESLEAQQRDLADQVSMSSVTLSLRSESDAPAVDPGDFWSGLAAGWAAFTGFWATLLVVLGVLTPWILMLAVIAVIVLLLVRRRRRRARLAPAPQPAAPQADERISASSDSP